VYIVHFQIAPDIEGNVIGLGAADGALPLLVDLFPGGSGFFLVFPLERNSSLVMTPFLSTS